MTYDLIGTAEAARLLDKSPATVRRMVKAGTLEPKLTAPGGYRPAFLFDRAEVLALAKAAA